MSGLSKHYRGRKYLHENWANESWADIENSDNKILFSLLIDDMEHFKVAVKFNQPESEVYMKTKYPDHNQQLGVYNVVLDVLLDALKQFQTHVNKERTSARYRHRNRNNGFLASMLINTGTIEADLQVIKHNPELFGPRCLKGLIRGLGYLNNAIDVVQELLQAAQTAYPFINFN